MSAHRQRGSNRKQFSVEVQENGKRIHQHTIDDPFARTTTRVAGLRNALLVLFHRYELVVRIDGTHEAHRVVFGGDYTQHPWTSRLYKLTGFMP